MADELRRHLLYYASFQFAGTAAFPHLAHLLRWPRRLGPRGLALYIAWTTLHIFAVRTWVVPRLRRKVEWHAATKAELAERLGREPTNDELIEHFIELARESPYDG